MHSKYRYVSGGRKGRPYAAYESRQANDNLHHYAERMSAAMKPVYSFILISLFSILLCGCAPETDPVETTIPVAETTVQTQPAATGPSVTYATALEAYEALWNGDATATNLMTSTPLDIHTLEGLYSPAPLSVSAMGFSILDLDKDGTEEMILRVNQEYPEHTLYNTPILLRFQNGSLDAQALDYEGFQNVKTDGSFHFFYPETSRMGYAVMEFTGESWHRTELAEAKPDENGGMAYFVNGEATARGIYRDAELAQMGKPDVIEYSDWRVYQQESTAAPVVPADKASALAAYGEVFGGTKEIYRTASQEWISLDEISLFLAGDVFPWTVAQIAVLDLDTDGTPEVVMEISNDSSYVILRAQEDGTVTGDGIWYRAFQELKADGTYRGSGSSFNRSYWKSHHAGDLLLAECYEENGQAFYWLDGREVTEADFLAFEEIQNQKPDAVWYPSWEDYLTSFT